MRAASVTVVIPVLDMASFIGEALESALSQDHRPAEVIVVDDGSTDGSGEVARGFDGVTVIVQEHAGPSVARNTGVARATGDLIAFHDADDVMAPGRLSAQVAGFEERPWVGCILGEMEVVYEPGVPERPFVRRDPQLLVHDQVPIMSAMVRADVARSVPFDPSFEVAEDIDWLLRLRSAGVEISVLSQVLLTHRRHTTNLSYRVREYKSGMLRSVHGSLSRGRVAKRGT